MFSFFLLLSSFICKLDNLRVILKVKISIACLGFLSALLKPVLETFKI